MRVSSSSVVDRVLADRCTAGGLGLSPQVQWDDLPEDTERVAVVLTELGRRPRVRWAAYNIAATEKRLEQGARAQGHFQVAKNEINEEQAFAAPDRKCRLKLEVIAQATSLGRDIHAQQVVAELQDRPRTALECTFTPRPGLTSLLFAGHPRLAWLFGNPFRTFACLMSASVGLLILPALLLGVYSVPPSAQNVLNSGFFFEFNWGPLYLIVIPAFFSIAAIFANRLHSALAILCGPEQQVFCRKKDGKPALELPTLIRRHNHRIARRTFYLCAAAAVLMTLIDVHSLATDYVRCLAHGTCTFSSQYHDWSIIRAVGGATTSVVLNLAFCVVAYAYEGFASFLFLFVAIKFFQALSQLRRHVFVPNQDYSFSPVIGDDSHKLGLGPLGSAYNAYLGLVVMFYAYVAAHRAQLTMRDAHLSIVEFVKTCATPPLPNLGSGMQAGMLLLLLVGIPIAIGVIVYFPLFTIRRFIIRKRNELLKTNNGRQQALKEERSREDDTDSSRARDLTKDIERLRNEAKDLAASESWPNGNRVALASLFACLLLFVAAIHPYLLGYLSAAGVVGTAAGWVWGWLGLFKKKQSD